MKMFLQARLEETVSMGIKDQNGGEALATRQHAAFTPTKTLRSKESATTSRAASQAVNDKDLVNYIAYKQSITAYTLYKDGRILVAIIETELRSNTKFAHVVAQAIGYYATLLSGELYPPLVFILSDVDIEIILFLFRDGQYATEEVPLINAVKLGKLKLWTKSNGFNLSVMYTLLDVLVKGS